MANAANQENSWTCTINAEGVDLQAIKKGLELSGWTVKINDNNLEGKFRKAGMWANEAGLSFTAATGYAYITYTNNTSIGEITISGRSKIVSQLITKLKVNLLTIGIEIQ